MAVALICLGAIAHVRPATAQSMPLSDLALAEFDLPGFLLQSEQSPSPPAGFDALFTRTFANTDHGPAVLIDLLLQPGPDVPGALVDTIVTDGRIMQGFSRSSGSQVANFSVTGPLNAGELDQSSAWDAYNDEYAMWFRFYADIFRRNGVIAAVVYASPSSTADPTALASYAMLQDQKIEAAGR
jgi:hypothetical protein